MSAAEEGTPNNRKATAAGAVSARASNMEGQQERDAIFVHTTLMEDGKAKLASYTAGLLRDGFIQRGMDKAANAASKLVGKKLPPMCRRLLNLPKSFNTSWVFDKVDSLKEVEDEAALSPAEEEDPFEIDPDLIDASMMWALRQDEECELPKDFPGQHYENPMKAAIDEVYNTVGQES